MSEHDLETPLLEVRESEEMLLVAISSRRQGTAADASTRDTCFLIISIYVGLGLLSQPYALKLGGWAALGVLLVTAALFFTSATLLTRACDLLPHTGEPRSLPRLGSTLWGAPGKHFVSFVAGLELFGSLAICLVVVFQQIELFLPTEGIGYLIPMEIAILITALLLLPALALRDVSRLAPLAIIGSSASACVALAVLALAPLDPHRQKMPHQPPPGHKLINFPGGLLQSLGIFAVSMSGHSTLPAVRQAMRNPDRFPVAVAGAFGTMAVAYALVAGVGYWYFGDGVSPIAIFDLTTNSPYSRSPGGSPWQQWLAVDRILGLLVLCNCCAKVPALVMVIQELIMQSTSTIGSTAVGGAPSTTSAPGSAEPAAVPVPAVVRFEVQYIVRLSVAAGAMVVSVAARQSLGAFLSLVGGACSMTTSLVLPVLFYMQLSWGSTRKAVRGLLVALVGVLSPLLLTVTALNLQELFGGGGDAPA